MEFLKNLKRKSVMYSNKRSNSQKKMKFKELKFNFKDYFIYTSQTTLSNEVYGCMGNLVNMNKKKYINTSRKNVKKS